MDTNLNLGTLVGSYFVGILTHYLQRYLKRFDFYKTFVTNFPMADRYVHRGVAALIALFGVLGISYTVTGTLNTGIHLGFDIPAADQMLQALIAAGIAFTGQQSMYDKTRRPESMPHDPPASKAALKTRMGN